MLTRRAAHTKRVAAAEAMRETVTSDPATRPVLLRTEMSAGHGGRSGRYEKK